MKWLQGFVADLFQAVQLARKDCLVLLHYRGAVVFVIVMPVIMVVITGLALKGLEPREIVVALEDQDHGEVADRLRHAMEQPGETGDTVHFAPEALDPAEARRRVAAGELGGLIVLPEGLSQRRQQGEDPRVELLVGPLQPPERALLAGTVGRLAAGAGAAGSALECTVTSLGNPPPQVKFNSFAQAVAGNGVLFILLNCIMTGGVSLVRERRSHTMDRLMMAPMSRGAIVLGKVMGVYALGLAQAVLLLGFGLAIGVPMGNFAGVVLVTLVFILVGCAVGLTVSALAGREDSVQMIGGPVSMLMTALGGGLFPTELAPRWMQTVALLLPTGWAMNAYHQLMWSPDKGVIAVLPNLLVLTGFAAVFFALGVRLLRWE